MFREPPASISAPHATRLPELLPSASRLAELLQTNDAPLESEIQAIRQILSDDEARVGVLNAEIDLLRIAMEELVAERDQIQKCARKYAAVLSPVRRVPPELMGEIFSLTLPHTRQIEGIPVDCPPWRLGHICKSWRNWALTDPFLWCSIAICDHFSSDLRLSYSIPMIETQLLRSGNVPLTVAFDSRACDWVESRRWDLLLSECDRWSSVLLRCMEDFHILSRWLARWGRFPEMKKLELITYSDGHPLLHPLNCFSIAPNLREIILTDPGYRYKSVLLSIPWSQITRYRGRFLAMHQLEILEVASNLIECGLGFLDAPRDIFEDKTVTLPHLRRLYVGDCDFLTHLTTPALEVLCSFGQIYPLAGLVSRSSCRLTRLVLEECEPLDALVRLLGDLPSLEYLLVDNRYCRRVESKNLFNSLTISGASSDLCPRLTSLAYGLGYSYADHPFQAPDIILVLVAMTRSRLRLTSPCRLSSLRLFSLIGDSRFKNAITEIQILTEEGLDFAFFCGDNAVKTLIAKDRP
ncbi:hypothetical protein C8R44DRAFT_978242 [Mycena epipterygia]|nr:hypothetical protein C8R44DRAFT_978242 [Mycena epipterygia]